MKKFKVPVREVITYTMSIVEAEGYEEAVEVAKDAYIMGDYYSDNQEKAVYINKERFI